MRSISRFILAFARRVVRDVLDQLNILYCVNWLESLLGLGEQRLCDFMYLNKEELYSDDAYGQYVVGTQCLYDSRENPKVTSAVVNGLWRKRTWSNAFEYLLSVAFLDLGGLDLDEMEGTERMF
jgi:hypothetical protein